MKADLTENMEGANGEAEIAEEFCKVYEELYNSSGSDEALHALKEFIKNKLANNDETMNEVFKITGVVVKEAACKLKSAKVMLVKAIQVIQY